MTYQPPKPAPNVCARCQHRKSEKWGYYSHQKPLCAAHTTTKIDPVTGKQVVDDLQLCWQHNPEGLCPAFTAKVKRTHKPKPPSKLSVFAQGWYRAFTRAWEERS